MEIVYASIFTFYLLKYDPLFWAYQSPENFHEYHINIQPDGVESRTLLASRFMRKSDPYSMFHLISEGLKYRPYDFKLLIVMMETMFMLNLNKQAFQIMRICEKYIPLGDEKDAKKEFKELRNNKNWLPKELWGIKDFDIETEYSLVQNKVSTLHAAQREKIVEAWKLRFEKPPTGSSQTAL